MEQLIDEKKAIAYAENYFNALKETGYVSKGITMRFLLYFFLIDFIKTMYVYMTDKDYQEIYRLMGNIFGTGGCLLPYPVFCVNRLKVGMPYIMTGYSSMRLTEQLNNFRSMEDENLRRF